jgi:hypothetical protein
MESSRRIGIPDYYPEVRANKSGIGIPDYYQKSSRYNGYKKERPKDQVAEWDDCNQGHERGRGFDSHQAL